MKVHACASGSDVSQRIVTRKASQSVSLQLREADSVQSLGTTTLKLTSTPPYADISFMYALG